MTPGLTYNISLAILMLLLGAQIFLRPSFLVNLSRIVFAGVAAVGLAFAGYHTYEQFFIWKEHPVSQFLLPPHQTLGYFASYAFFNFFASFLAALAIAFAGFWAVRILDHKFPGRFFQPAEKYLFGVPLFLLGYPAAFYYVAVLLVAGLASLLIYKFLLKKENHLFSFYYFWIPSAFLVILFKNTFF